MKRTKDSRTKKRCNGCNKIRRIEFFDLTHWRPVFREICRPCFLIQDRAARIRQQEARRLKSENCYTPLVNHKAEFIDSVLNRTTP